MLFQRDLSSVYPLCPAFSRSIRQASKLAANRFPLKPRISWGSAPATCLARFHDVAQRVGVGLLSGYRKLRWIIQCIVSPHRVVEASMRRIATGDFWRRAAQLVMCLFTAMTSGQFIRPLRTLWRGLGAPLGQAPRELSPAIAESSPSLPAYPSPLTMMEQPCWPLPAPPLPLPLPPLPLLRRSFGAVAAGERGGSGGSARAGQGFEPTATETMGADRQIRLYKVVIRLIEHNNIAVDANTWLCALMSAFNGSDGSWGDRAKGVGGGRKVAPENSQGLAPKVAPEISEQAIAGKEGRRERSFLPVRSPGSVHAAAFVPLLTKRPI